MKLDKYFAILFGFVSISNALSCPPQEVLTLRLQFYTSWIENEPFPEFHVLETFKQAEYSDVVWSQPSTNDMLTTIAFAQAP